MARWQISLFLGFALIHCGKSSPPKGGTGGPVGDLGAVTAVADRDSAIIHIPAFPGAMDYRAYVAGPGVSASTDGDGRETITGGVVFCAGMHQHNAKPPAVPQVMQDIEVAGLTGASQVVVEALDRPCPFQGVRGTQHVDYNVTWMEVEPAAKGIHSVYTAAEIAAKYGSLQVNGQGAGSAPGIAAPPNPPKILGRSTLTVTPLATSARKTSTFFDDFSGNDPLVLAQGGLNPGVRNGTAGALWQNSKWSFYTWNGLIGNAPAAPVSQIFIDGGKLHTVLADDLQDVFASWIGFPRRLAQLSSTSYLHMTWEVASDATTRRYWWIAVCGADTAGQTMTADGKLTSPFIQTPFFYAPDGRDPSLAGWNCFQLFPRSGTSFPLGPDNTPPQSMVRVMVNTTGPGGDVRTGVVNVSPPQFDPVIQPPDWYREQEGGHPVAPMLDDYMVWGPSQQYDLYLRRNRAVLFVNGRQKLCNDFTGNALTMAEAAVGFGSVLYHSAAERLEFSSSFWDTTGQQHILQNVPFVDERTWDNLGYDENVAAPSSFDATKCFAH